MFFLSIVSHQLFPRLSKLIFIDADVKFRADIRKLWSQFEKFSAINVIGISYEHQPVYRHVLNTYRQQYPKTNIGSPPPEGNPGFNSGVILLDLTRMRNSALYREYLSQSSRIRSLCEKYYFKGHLGDQDFYTLLGFEQPDIFYVLPCTWNRQLCTWWKDNGYREVFHMYHKCDGYVNLYHGNCGTAIPYD